MVCKIFFCSEFLDIPENLLRRRRWRRPANVNCPAFQATATSGVQSCEKILEKVCLFAKLENFIKVGRPFAFVWKVLSDFGCVLKNIFISNNSPKDELMSLCSTCRYLSSD